MIWVMVISHLHNGNRRLNTSLCCMGWVHLYQVALLASQWQYCFYQQFILPGFPTRSGWRNQITAVVEISTSIRSTESVGMPLTLAFEDDLLTTRKNRSRAPAPHTPFTPQLYSYWQSFLFDCMSTPTTLSLSFVPTWPKHAATTTGCFDRNFPYWVCVECA